MKHGLYLRWKADGKSDFRILPKEHSMHDGTKITVYLIQWDLWSNSDKKQVCDIRIDFQCSILQKTNEY